MLFSTDSPEQDAGIGDKEKKYIVKSIGMAECDRLQTNKMRLLREVCGTFVGGCGWWRHICWWWHVFWWLWLVVARLLVAVVGGGTSVVAVVGGGTSVVAVVGGGTSVVAVVGGGTSVGSCG